MSASTGKYNVRERLKGKVVMDEELHGNIGLGYEASTDSNSNESFTSIDDSGASERFEFPMRNPVVDFGQKKSTPGTPVKGFMGRNIDINLAR